MHGEDARAASQSHLEQVAVAAPLLPDEVEKAVPADAVDEPERADSGDLHGRFLRRAAFSVA